MYDLQDHYLHLLNWCLRKTQCTRCFPADKMHHNEWAVTAALYVFRGVMEKSTEHRSDFFRTGYLRHADDHLRALLRQQRTGKCLVTRSTAELWFSIYDHHHLAHPDIVTHVDLMAGAIPVAFMPTFGWVDNHHATPYQRALQFLHDYFGVARTYQLNTAGILGPLINAVATHRSVRTHGESAFGEHSFHQRLHAKLIELTFAHQQQVVDHATSTQVYVDEYFASFPPSYRAVIYEQVCDQLGVTPLTTN